MQESHQDKIRSLESRKGLNHPLFVLRNWLEESYESPDFARSIQIAGTNGKGSVLRWLECLLGALHLPSASFSSPHLLHHAERFRINGQSIDQNLFCHTLDTLYPLIEDKEMTMFEADLFLACALFQNYADMNAFVIMEVGMGGEKDATTALHYPYGIITHVGLDHMAYLGSTKEEIARAKAGIIKPGMTIICAERDPACLSVFQKEAQKQGADLILPPSVLESTLDFSSFWNDRLPAYQKENLITALCLLETIGASFTAKQLKKAVDAFDWPARFQRLRTDPLVLLDGAHNPDGIEALVQSVQSAGLQIDDIYFSVLADKQAGSMIRTLQTLGTSIHLVRFENERLAELEMLAGEFSLPLLSFDEMISSLKNTDRSSLICGSLYFAGEVLKVFTNAR